MFLQTRDDARRGYMELTISRWRRRRIRLYKLESVQPAGHRHTNLLYYTGDERVLMLHALPEGARQSEELHRRHAFHRECSKLKQLREDEWVLDEERKRSEGEEDAGD